jgi:hypothetical protein
VVLRWYRGYRSREDYLGIRPASRCAGHTLTAACVPGHDQGQGQGQEQGQGQGQGQDQAQGCSLLGLELVRAGIARRVRVRVRAAGQGCGQGYTSRVQVSVRARLRFGPRTGATKAQSQVGLGLAERSSGGYMHRQWHLDIWYQ